MPGLLRVSEAASLGLHAVVFLAANPDRMIRASEIARELGASENHLAKVLQRLVRGGLVRSARGPRGGFSLARPARSISLLKVYEATEGRLNAERCLFGKPIWGGGGCILGDLMGKVNALVKERLAGTTLDQVAHVCGRKP